MTAFSTGCLASSWPLESCWLIFLQAFVFCSEFAFVTIGEDPIYELSKLLISMEAEMEVEALQHYVLALADADLEDADVLHVSAALGHNGTTHNNVLQLLGAQRDWASFLSPAQIHAHALVQQLPLDDTQISRKPNWRRLQNNPWSFPKRPRALQGDPSAAPQTNQTSSLMPPVMN